MGDNVVGWWDLVWQNRTEFLIYVGNLETRKVVPVRQGEDRVNVLNEAVDRLAFQLDRPTKIEWREVYRG
jgi:hypothetical protein